MRLLGIRQFTYQRNSTSLDDRSVITGGEQILKRCIGDTQAKFEGKDLCVISNFVPHTIGDNVEQIVRECTVLDNEVLSRHPYVGCISKQGAIEYFPILSPGLLWSYASCYFRQREGTLMAIAYACRCEEITDLIDDDLNAMSAVSGEKYHDYLNVAVDIAKKIIKRITDYTPYDEGKHFLNFDSRFSESENKISMIMKQIQKLSIRIMENNVEQVIEKAAMNPLKP